MSPGHCSYWYTIAFPEKCYSSDVFGDGGIGAGGFGAWGVARALNPKP